MRRRALLAAARTALLTAPLAALAGCSGFGDGTTSPTERPTDSPSPTSTPATVRVPDIVVLDVVEHERTRSNEGSDSELVAVHAVIENEGDEAVTDVRAVARFFDESGDLLDESSARTDRIAAGGRWEIELTFPGSGADARAVADYRLVVELVD